MHNRRNVDTTRGYGPAVIDANCQSQILVENRDFLLQWYRKIRMLQLPDGEKNEYMFIRNIVVILAAKNAPLFTYLCIKLRIAFRFNRI